MPSGGFGAGKTAVKTSGPTVTSTVLGGLRAKTGLAETTRAVRQIARAVPRSMLNPLLLLDDYRVVQRDRQWNRFQSGPEAPNRRRQLRTQRPELRTQIWTGGS